MIRYLLLIIFLYSFFACKSSECPPEMVELNMKSKAYCIDKYESYIIGYSKDGKPYRYAPKFEYVIKKDGKFQPGNYFNKEELKDKIFARSAKGMQPVDGISWMEADIACRNSGKRLCTAEEWDFACMGKNKQKYPYGNEYVEENCNGYEYGRNRGIVEILPSGYAHKCDNGSGVMDLSGNLWEWIDATDTSKTLKLVKGGGFGNSGYDEETLSCTNKRYQPPEIRLSGVGFRCCRDR